MELHSNALDKKFGLFPWRNGPFDIDCQHPETCCIELNCYHPDEWECKGTYGSSCKRILNSKVFGNSPFYKRDIETRKRVISFYQAMMERLWLSRVLDCSVQNELLMSEGGLRVVGDCVRMRTPDGYKLFACNLLTGEEYDCGGCGKIPSAHYLKGPITDHRTFCSMMNTLLERVGSGGRGYFPTNDVLYAPSFRNGKIASCLCNAEWVLDSRLNSENAYTCVARFFGWGNGRIPWFDDFNQAMCFKPLGKTAEQVYDIPSGSLVLDIANAVSNCQCSPQKLNVSLDVGDVNTRSHAMFGCFYTCFRNCRECSATDFPFTRRSQKFSAWQLGMGLTILGAFGQQAFKTNLDGGIQARMRTITVDKEVGIGFNCCGTPVITKAETTPSCYTRWERKISANQQITGTDILLPWQHYKRLCEIAFDQIESGYWCVDPLDSSKAYASVPIEHLKVCRTWATCMTQIGGGTAMRHTVCFPVFDGSDSIYMRFKKQIKYPARAFFDTCYKSFLKSLASVILMKKTASCYHLFCGEWSICNRNHFGLVGKTRCDLANIQYCNGNWFKQIVAYNVEKAVEDIAALQMRKKFISPYRFLDWYGCGHDLTNTRIGKMTSFPVSADWVARQMPCWGGFEFGEKIKADCNWVNDDDSFSYKRVSIFRQECAPSMYVYCVQGGFDVRGNFRNLGYHCHYDPNIDQWVVEPALAIVARIFKGETYFEKDRFVPFIQETFDSYSMIDAFGVVNWRFTQNT